ncbi:diaminopimelate epimerase [Verticiella sediminum]|uniref:Diaminopimelate epimerase n=1 Tax=Verticiella sediminum TaxID=1247510 RepID=A0A556AB23_9BURK|nr:diaminopimelate epimerase [Verticiella sediminum]TSH90067.1 diaminopimelate epimerase [Verticiella sediminum]
MIWSFTKMHGAGNDFVMLDGVTQDIALTPQRVRALAHRQFGIGADQVLLVEKASVADADFRYRIFNADGGEVEHCGNGARCFVRFVHHRGLSSANPLRAQIASGVITLQMHADHTVTVDMGTTRFEPEALPFDTHGLTPRSEGVDTLWPIDTQPESWVSLVAVSNPHAVQVVENVDTAPVGTVGPAIERHPRFAHRVNAGFMQVVDRHHIRLRVYERGAGETLACGTGACAAVAAGIRRGMLDSPVRVDTRGGRLDIAWDGSHLRMTGPTAIVFDGAIATATLDNMRLPT